MWSFGKGEGIGIISLIDIVPFPAFVALTMGMGHDAMASSVTRSQDLADPVQVLWSSPNFIIRNMF